MSKWIIEKLADRLGLVDEWKQKGKNEVFAEIAIIDRELAGFCEEHNYPKPYSRVIEYLKYYLMDTDSYLEHKGYDPDAVGKRGAKFIKSMIKENEKRGQNE